MKEQQKNYKLDNLKYKSNIQHIFIMCVGLLSALYITLRAIFIDITIDEATSYLYATQHSFTDCLFYRIPSANTHWLNAILVWICNRFFGSSLLSIRLPNVLAGIVFIIFSWKIVHEFVPSKLRLSSFVILVGNHYLINYFSLERGYGLAACSVIIAMYHLIAFYNSASKYHLAMSLLAAILACISNFSMLYFYVSVFSVAVILILKQSNSKGYFLLMSIISMLVLLAIIVEPIQWLRDNNELYYGGTIGFWEDTVHGLIEKTIPNITWLRTLLSILIYGFITVSFLFSFVFLISKKSHESIITILVLSISILLPVVAFYLLENRLPIERTALFYIPIFNLLFIALVSIHYFKWEKLTSYITHFYAVVFAFIFLVQINFKTTTDWQFCSSTNEAIAIINKEIKPTEKVYVSYFLKSSFEYYQQRGCFNHQLDIIENDSNEAAILYVMKTNFDTLNYNTKFNIIKHIKSSNCLILHRN